MIYKELIGKIRDLIRDIDISDNGIPGLDSCPKIEWEDAEEAAEAIYNLIKGEENDG